MRVEVARRCTLVAIAGLAVWGWLVAPAQAGAVGALTQLSGTPGCVRSGGGLGCARGRALAGPASVAVSSDSRNVYIASVDGSEAIAVFARDSLTGALHQLPGRAGCVNLRGRRDVRAGGHSQEPSSVAVSGDGRNVYVASLLSDNVAVFARDPATGRCASSPGGRAA
jgi:DNA-binding beta-propeller fold protein YncE